MYVCFTCIYYKLSVMVYIPSYIVEKLDALSVYDVAEKLGLVVSRNMALCFMHQDHHPSLHFKKSNNSWKCYVCGVGGHSIELVKRYNNYSFQEACVWLSRKFNIPIPESKGIKLKKTPVKYVASSSKESSNQQVDEEVLNWIISKAQLSEQAKHFLFVEREYSKEIVAVLKIGSISDSEKFVAAITATYPKERCLKAGVLMEYRNSLYPVFRVPCLLFPYYDMEGHIRNIQSRYLGMLENGDKRRFNNCKGIAPIMFNSPILKSSERYDKIYVAEGVTDCIALLSEGKKAIALPGAGSFRPEYAEFLRDKTLFMYVDNDEAGNSLFEKMNKTLKKIGNCIHNIRKDTKYKDYSDYYLGKRHEKDSKKHI